MNTIYRVVWNPTACRWIVASELARGRKKRSSTTAMALLLCTGVIAGRAQADCGTNPVANYTTGLVCTPSAGIGAGQTTQAGTTVTVSTGTAPAIHTVANGADATATIVGTSITQSSSGQGIETRVSSGVGTANTLLSGANMIALGANADTAILTTGVGNSSIVVTDFLTVTNSADNAQNRDGLEVNAGGALSSLNHQGSGMISTRGGNAVLATGFGAGTSVSVNIGNQVALRVDNTVSGASGFVNSGIRTTTSGGNNVVNNAASIETSGANAFGILSSSGAGNTDVTNSGSIITNGIAVDGIRALSSGNGNVSVTHSGTILSEGASARGIQIQSSTGGGSGYATLTMNGGSVTTRGANADAHGLEVQARGTGTGSINLLGGSVSSNGGAALIVHTGGAATSVGDIRVNTAAGTTLHSTLLHGITVGGASAAAGTSILIDSQSDITAGGMGINAASTTGGAPITIRQTGGSITAGNYGINASTAGAIDIEVDSRIESAGLAAVRAAGTANQAVTVDNLGTLLATGPNGKGIAVTGGGDLTVQHHDGALIETRGDGSSAPYSPNSGAAGIYMQTTAGSAGTARAVIDGDILTTGSNRAGGAFVQSQGSGDAIIVASGDITIDNAAGPYSYGLSTSLLGASATGDASIESHGNIRIAANDSIALYAYVEPGTSNAGDLRIDNTGTLTTTGDGISYGIWGRVLSGGSGVTLNNSGAISTSGTVGTLLPTFGGPSAIRADSLAGAIHIVNSGALSTEGETARGISAISTTGDISIDNAGDIATRGEGAYAISAVSDDGAVTITTTGGRIDTLGDGAVGLNAVSNGAVSVDNASAIATAGIDSDGIVAVGLTDAGATVVNRAALVTTGVDAQGLHATTQTGALTAGNSGAISTSGATSHGIQISSASGDVTLENTGDIATHGAQADAILAAAHGAGSPLITQSGALSTDTDESAGIRATTEIGTLAITTTGGSIDTLGASAFGITASGSGPVSVDNASAITTVGSGAHGVFALALGASPVSVNNASVITTRGADAVGIDAFGSGAVSVTNTATGQVHGGGGSAGAGVRLGASMQTLLNAGDLDALSDRAVIADNGAAGTLDISNTGTMLGTVTASTSVSRFDNAGLWNLRRFADTDGDGVRETLDVAVSNFGGSGDNTLNNLGTLALLTHDGSGTALDTTGMYLPFGNAYHTIALASPAQGHILGVQRFYHSGLINLQANPSVGDVLVISGGATAGVNGGGVFISDGGTLWLDTVLDDGGSDYRSDVLVVDATQNRLGPTGIVINNVGGSGAVTTGDGIALVQVLDRTRSPGDVFVLANRAVAGAYEYLLFRGGSAINGGDPDDGNWYLRSELPVPPPCEETGTCPPPPPCEETGTCPPPPPCEETGTCPPPPPPPPCEVTGTCPPPPPCEETDTCPPPPPPPPVPCEVTNTCPPPDPDPDPDPDPAPAPLVPLFRAEIGAYLGNQLAASSAFMHTLHDRLGEVDYTERARDDDTHAAAWTRVTRRQFNTRSSLRQLDIDTDATLMQVGAEFGRWTDGDARWHLGAMGGWLQSSTHSRSTLVGYRAKGTLSGYGLGVYGTWYQSAGDPRGLYVDAWLNYGGYQNKVQGDLLPTERYDSHAWNASIEAGYAMELRRGEQTAWYVEPQAQIIHSEFDADDHIEVNGTRVHGSDAGGLVTRIGVRTYTRPIDTAHNRVQPFLALNWWHYDGDGMTLAFNDSVQRLERDADVYELKLGAQIELGGGWTAWGHAAISEVDGSADDVEGLLGVKYGW